jgi:acetate kinase
MGFTPLEGLMMGSRSGDIDPAIVLYLQREHSYTVEQIDTMLNSKSGLKGICSVSDMRQINLMIEQGDSKALLAHDMFCRRVGKYIGAYHALLGRVDAVVFTGGIGEHDSMTREKIAEYIRFDTTQMVIPTDEELVIARETSKLVISK